MLLSVCMSGCASYSQYVPANITDSHTPFSLLHPENKILIIYNHGSQAENKKDYCYPNSWTTPSVIKRLSGDVINGLEVVVYGFCSPWRFGGYNGALRMGEPKVLKRAKSLEILVKQFIEHGVPGNRIFLAGHSAGAWASLLVARRGEVEFNSVIGFAPAFSGKEADRSEGWWELRNQHVDYLQQAQYLPALIYAFESDPFNDPSDLSFLGTIAGVVLINSDELPGATDGNDCPEPRGHRGPFKSCFSETQLSVIRDYIQQRLASHQGVSD